MKGYAEVQQGLVNRRDSETLVQEAPTSLATRMEVAERWVGSAFVRVHQLHARLMNPGESQNTAEQSAANEVRASYRLLSAPDRIMQMAQSTEKMICEIEEVLGV